MREIQVVKSPVNPILLDEELAGLGEVYTGVSTNTSGVCVFLEDVATTTDITNATALVNAHDHTGVSDVELTETANEAKETAALTDFASLPGWATWTGQEAADWVDTNVTDPASAKVALMAMARAIMYLRNMIAPDLEGG